MVETLGCVVQIPAALADFTIQEHFKYMRRVGVWGEDKLRLAVLVGLLDVGMMGYVPEEVKKTWAVNPRLMNLMGS